METNYIKTESGKKTTENAGKVSAMGAIGGIVGGAGAGVASAYVTSEVLKDQKVEHGTNGAQTNTGENPTNPTGDPVIVDPVLVDPGSLPTDPSDVTITDPILVSNNVEPVNPQNASDPLRSEDSVSSDSPFDINDVVDDILAIEEIDPNDIDWEDVFAFEEIGIYYTVTGDEWPSALFLDDYGNQLFLVDVDGDLAYDYMVDGDEYVISVVDGLITQADVELQLLDSEESLFADNVVIENIEELDFSQDLIG